MNRRLARGLAATTATVAIIGVAAPAGAAPTPNGGIAYSAAAVLQSGGISASIRTTGTVGALIAPLTDPVFAAATDTLIPALNGLTASIRTALAGVVTGNGLEATTPTAQMADPTPAWPTCSAAGWSTSNCYRLTNVVIPAVPTVALSIPTVRGYTVVDSTASRGLPFTSRAEASHPVLDVLGIAVGDLGLVASNSTCATSGSTPAAPVSSSSLSGMSLFGGQVTVGTATSAAGLADVKINGTALSGTQAIRTVEGLPATVRLDGGFLSVAIDLSLSGLLKGLGLGAISGLLAAVGISSDLQLTLRIGPGSQPTSTNTSSWGMSIQAGLSGTLNVTLLGLVGAAITVSASAGVSASANVLDLRLASTNCTTGQAPGAGDIWIPPGLI